MGWGPAHATLTHFALSACGGSNRFEMHNAVPQPGLSMNRAGKCQCGLPWPRRWPWRSWGWK